MLLFLVPLTVGQEADISLDYTISRGSIQIVVRGEHSNSVEFYEGDYDLNDINYVDPLNRAKGNFLLSCNSNGVCDAISFDAVDIFEPGNYYFLVRDLKQKAARANFVLTFDNLLSCNYNEIAIRNNRCIDDFTNDVNDKPKYCRNQQIIVSCTLCGCPNSEQICSSNGECIIPAAEPTPPPTPPPISIPQRQLEQLGCIFPDSNSEIPDGVCVNRIITSLDASNSLFGYNCECSLIDEADPDKDGDGYDSAEFNGIDCDDENEHINPDIVESCQAGLGNNNIDEDCSGRDLDCGALCDDDEDERFSRSPFYCPYAARALGRVTEADDNNPNIYPGAPEICNGRDDNEDGNVDEDLSNCLCTGVPTDIVPEIKSSAEICDDNVDNNCNGQVDELAQCDQCRNGDAKRIEGLCQDGESVCRNGRWETIRRAVNECNPSLFIGSNDGVNRIVNFPRNSRMTVSSTFTCQERNGCNDVDVRLNV